MHALQPFTFRLPAAPSWSGVSMRAPAPARPLARDADAPAPRGMEQPATRWEWHSRFGTIVIEVRADEVFVNGDRVEPHAR
jgi:hypothetical protein